MFFFFTIAVKACGALEIYQRYVRTASNRVKLYLEKDPGLLKVARG